MIILFDKLDAEAKSPTHNNAGDAGLDFYTLEPEKILGNSYKVVKTGIRVQVPEGHVGLLFPKGKNDHLLGAGVIDTYYEGEVLFKVVNYTDETMWFVSGHPIGQMIFVPFAEPVPFEAHLKSRNSERGDSGGIKKDLEKCIGQEVEIRIDNHLLL